MRQLWGIDGGQGSGKTTYAKQLVAGMKSKGIDVIYIETDDFLSERQFRNSLKPTFFDNFSNLQLLFDFDRMKKTLQEFLTTDKTSVKLDNLYNGLTGLRDLSKTFKISANTLILVGGPYLLQKDWPAFNHKIFMDVPENVRLERTLRRNRNKDKPRSIASQQELFTNFEKFYNPYWGGRLSEYDEIVNSPIS